MLITDGNDTVNKEASSIAATVNRLSENGVKIDTIFLNSTLKEGETEVQLSGAELAPSAYLNHDSEVNLLIQSSGTTNVMLELLMRDTAVEGEEFERIGYTVVNAEPGLDTVTMTLPTNISGEYEYKAVITADDDISSYNNECTFRQTVVGKTKVLLVTGKSSDVSTIQSIYGSDAEIDSYVVSAKNNHVPFTIESIIEYDEIIVSNVDVRDINNANAFIDSLDNAVSQYGKSLITLGNLYIQTEDDPLFTKFQEILPVDYGNSAREGKLYTIVLDVSHSMFMAYKFTIARESAIKLLSLLNDDDYICLVTFSGEIKVRTPARVGDVRQELVQYIDALYTSHGTDIGLGLEEAMKAIKALNLSENQVMLISDGFSFDNTKDAVEVAGQLFASGTPVSVINTYIPADGEQGRATLKRVVGAGEGGNYYEISVVENVGNVVFGSVANDVTEAVIEKNSTVNIERYRDGIVDGIGALSQVSGYVQSMAKYDATVPITVNYVKANGYTRAVPLYAYRTHGNGRIASLTTSLSDSWTGLWSDQERTRFVTNMLISNTPDARVDHPFTVTVEQNDYDAYVEITPGILNPKARADIVITLPNGKTISKTLDFDSRKYSYTFDTGKVGTYTVKVTYSYDDKVFSSTESFEIPYLPEYDAFAGFSKANIYEFMRGNGSIVEDEIPNLENERSEITTYNMSYRIPLLIAAIALFLLDVLIRKIKLSKKKKRISLKR